jgi:hypothetical protein
MKAPMSRRACSRMAQALPLTSSDLSVFIMKLSALA